MCCVVDGRCKRVEAGDTAIDEYTDQQHHGEGQIEVAGELHEDSQQNRIHQQVGHQHARQAESCRQQTNQRGSENAADIEQHASRDPLLVR
ncbi:hypothetical protein D3C81_2096960 [compost metagenome]